MEKVAKKKKEKVVVTEAVVEGADILGDSLLDVPTPAVKEVKAPELMGYHPVTGLPVYR